MREAFLLGKSDICRDVINPVFGAIDSLFLDEYEYVERGLLEVDRRLLGDKFKNDPSLLNENIRTRYVWYNKPAGFDPAVDPVLIFSHGGGFAIKLVPLSFVFLKNLSKYFPLMGIILHDYTVTVSKEDNPKHPLQLLETVALYDYITNDLGCQNVILMGESAGGNIVLSTVQYLYRTSRLLPKKVVALSPWCNPTSYGVKEKTSYPLTIVMDALSFEGLGRFTNLLVPDNYDFEEDPLLDIERNFDVKTWSKVLGQVKLQIVYGTDEILQHQIKEFIAKLNNSTSVDFNLANNVVVDEDGGHIEPVLNMTWNVKKWSQQNSIMRILDFLDK